MKKVLLSAGLFLYCIGVYGASAVKVEKIKAVAKDDAAEKIKAAIPQQSIEGIAKLALLTGNVMLLEGLSQAALLDLNTEFVVTSGGKTTLFASAVEGIDNTRRRTKDANKENNFVNVFRYLLTKNITVSSGTLAIVQQHPDLKDILAAASEHKPSKPTRAESDADDDSDEDRD